MREAQGISIRELARRADVDHTYLSRFEAGLLDKEPSRRWLRAVTDALGRELAHRCDHPAMESCETAPAGAGS